MSSLAKDEMESTHWSSDLIKLKTKACIISGIPKPNKELRPKLENREWGEAST